MVTDSTRLRRVIREVVAERSWQNEKWGGPAHDDTHSVQEFVGFIHEHAEKAITPGTGPDDTCRRLVEVAALAVAAVESIRRQHKNRTTFRQSAQRQASRTP